MTRRRFQGAKRFDPDRPLGDAALAKLQRKLLGWLMQQPEWLYVLSQPRKGRKLYGTMVGDQVTRVPTYVTAPPPTRKRLNIKLRSPLKVERVEELDAVAE